MPTNRTKVISSPPPIEPKYSDTLTIWQNEIKNKVSTNAVDQIPFVLMPVRLETRFIENNSSNSVLDELWVRIYPDDILIESPENKMTEEMFEVGENYWKEWWASGGDENKRKGAWRALCHAVGPRIAAWIVKKTKPINYPVQYCPFNHKIQISLVDTCHEVLRWYQDFNYVSVSKFKPNLWDQQVVYLDKLVTAQISRIEQFDINRDQHDDMVNTIELIEGEVVKFNDTINLFSDTNQFPSKPDYLGDPTEVISEYYDAIRDITHADANITIDSRIQNNAPSVSTLRGHLMASKFTDDDLDKLDKQLAGAIWYSNLAIKYNEAIANFDSNGLNADTQDLLSYQEALNNENTEQFNFSTDPAPGTRFLTGQEKINLINENALKVSTYVNFYSSRGSLFQTVSDQLVHLTESRKLIEQSRLYNKRNSLLLEYDMNYWLNQSVVIYDRFTNFKNIYWNRWYSTDCVEWNVFNHLPTNPTFPNKTGLVNSTWSGKPLCRLMPERFVAIGIKVTKNADGTESYTYEQLEVGNPVPSNLAIGIDPSQNTEYFNIDAQGNLVIDDSIKWLYDFQSAVDKGMAIKMKLTGTNIDGSSRTSVTYSMGGNVFDKLIVLGVKATDPLIEEFDNRPQIMEGEERPLLEDITKGLVESLFNAHHYSPNGLDILEFGTPTNNTSEKDSGYSFNDISPDESFGIEVDKPLFVKKDTYLDITDGQRLADALGLDYSVFEHIRNADKKQISEHLRANSLFFSGTLGHYMQEMFQGVLNYENVESVKKFFNTYVSARGMLPFIRVNNQPYGILATSAWTKWGFLDEQDLRNELYPDQFETSNRAPLKFEDFIDQRDKYMSFMTDLGSPTFFLRMKEVMDYMAFEWIKLSRTHVDFVKKNPTMPSGDNAQKEFMRILGLHPGSVEYYFRLFSSINTANFYQVQQSTNSSEIIPKLSIEGFNYSFFKHQIGFGLYHNVPNNTGVITDPDPRILYSYFLKESAKLVGDIVDPYPLSETKRLNKDNGQNYIYDLTRAKLIDVYNDNTLTTFPHSLLFILLRQTHLLSHLDLFQEYLIQNGYWDYNMFECSVNNKIKQDPGNGHLQRLPQHIVGKFHLAFKHTINQYNSSNNLGLFFNIANLLNTTNANKTLAELFQSYSDPANKLMQGNKAYYLKRLRDYRENLHYFKNHPTADLDRYLQEHIDLCSFRLDAWMSGYINQRLFHTRNLYRTNVDENNLYPDRVKGIYFGAYGWLENVKPGDPLSPLAPGNQSAVPESLRDASKNIYVDADNLGFIHSPSLTHAVTAAILRSGYLSNKKHYPNQSENDLSVSLTSDRVKKALFFIEGIRNGQSFGELLGYQFERGLHEKYNVELDEYIYPIRRKFPINEEITEPNSALSAEIKKSRSQNVIDGISLIAKVRERITGFTGSFYNAIKSTTYKSQIQADLDISGISDAKYDCIALELDYLADNIDAVADLAISEGVFQVVKGNYSRASSALDSLSNGKNLSEVEIVKTPRTGHSINHKIVKNFTIVNNHNQKPTGWGNIDLTMRAKADPSINFWIAEHIPHADNIGLVVKYSIGNDEFNPAYNLSQISKFHPIDLIYLLGSGQANWQGFEEQIDYFVRDQNTLNFDVEIELEYTTRHSSWDLNTYSIAELVPILKHLYLLINQSRSINASDFVAPSKDLIEAGKNHLGYDFTFHVNTLNGFKQDIQTHLATVNIEDIDNINLSGLRNFLIGSSKLGARFAMPQSVVESDGDEITLIIKKQVLAAHEALTAVLNKLISDISNIQSLQTSSAGETKILGLIETAYHNVMGADFKIAPKFKIKEVDVFNQLRSKSATLTRSPLVLDKDEWLYKIARVRNKMNIMETILTLSNKEFDFKPVQYPFKKDRNGIDDYWYGGEFPDSYVSTGDKQSICLLDDDLYENCTESTFFCGLLIDEWIEIIPAKKETTGVTFNYDQPNMKPPQSILLAVTPSPHPSGQWYWDNLVHTLLDTQLLYQMRAVEPDHIMKNQFMGQFFPAIVGCTEPPEIDTWNTGTNNQNFADLLFKYSENNIHKNSPPETLDNTRMTGISYPTTND